MQKYAKDFFSTVSYCVAFTWGSSRLYFVLRIALLLLGAILPYLSLYLSKQFIDLLAYNLAGAPSQVGLLIVLLVCLSLLGLGMRGIALLLQYVQTVHNEILNGSTTKRIMQKTITMDLAFFDSPNYLDTMQAVMIDSMSLSSIVWDILMGISGTVSFIVATIMLLEYSWFYTLILVLVSIPMSIMNQRYAKILYQWRLDNMEEERKKAYIQSVAQDKAHASDVRLFSLGPELIKRYQSLWSFMFYGRKKLQKRQLAWSLFTSLLPELCTLAFLIVLTLDITKGYSTLGDYTLLSGLFAALISALANMVNSIVSVYDNRLKVNTVKKFEEQENLLQDNGTQILDSERPLEIIFKDVVFSYPGTKRKILDNVSFSIHSKEKVCLLGVNGAGKSTIVKLLMRFYDVDEGCILVNGQDIREYTLTSLRRCFSTFFQDSSLYAFTLAENITISDMTQQDADCAALQQALVLAGADSFLDKLPKGLETYIYRIFDAEGYEPSGGESQKISLARAIYRRSNCIIFDEPTASLDPEAESKLFDSMASLWENKTALFTSHRLAAVHIADKILLLDEGCIAEQGTHDALVQAGGKYAYLYKLQASKYA